MKWPKIKQHISY